MTLSPGSGAQDGCGCADQPAAGTAAAAAGPGRYNRPGLPEISYRLGTHSTFLRRMLQRLPAMRIPDGPNAGTRPLAALTTRSPDDPAVALLDAWATVADVLTFYGERIANEGFLRTATERRSVLYLARAIGYELNPGVAAGTHLAFTVESAPGAPGEARVPAGTRVLSIPGQDELPQPFETAEELEARQEWNSLAVPLTEPHPIEAGTTELYLKGIDLLLQPGDALLLVGDERKRSSWSERWDFRYVKTVTSFREGGYTLVTWDTGLGEVPDSLPAENPEVYVFRQRAALFGWNAPEWRTLPADIQAQFLPRVPRGETQPTVDQFTDWPGFDEIRSGEETIDLDAVYPRILTGSWLALSKPSYVELYLLEDVDANAQSDFGISSKTTRVKLDTMKHVNWFPRRQTQVFAQSEKLELAERPRTTPVLGRDVELAAYVPGLLPGKALVFSGPAMRARVGAAGEGLQLVSPDGTASVTLHDGDSLRTTRAPETDAAGAVTWHLEDREGFAGSVTALPGQIAWERAAADDLVVSEVATLDEAVHGKERTTLRLQAELQHAFDPVVVVLGNVTRATHGETVREVLGSGDGSVSNQRFTLKKPPLTHVSAATASGSESTLEVRVDGVLWEEVPSLYGLPATAESYIVRLDDEGKATVIFGDGVNGARLPTGQENVTAVYRSGIGLAGEVDEGAITLLQARPFGVRGVVNPVPAGGAADPEVLEDARDNAPMTVLTLDRIVSLRDYEDFARAFAGIGKAQAVALWEGDQRLVHVTVASSSGEAVDPASDLYLNLSRAIDASRDPAERVEIDSFELLEFRVAAKVLVDARYLAEDVLAEAETAIRDAFAFERRGLAQPVTAAEVVTLVQGVEGVVAVDLDALDFATGGGGSGTGLASHLPARSARLEDTTIRPAQLLLLAAGGVTLTEMQQ